MLKILSHFILQQSTPSYTPLVIFFFNRLKKRLRFLKKTVAIKLLNATTGAVGDIQHHAEQFINLQ